MSNKPNYIETTMEKFDELVEAYGWDGELAENGMDKFIKEYFTQALEEQAAGFEQVIGEDEKGQPFHPMLNIRNQLRAEQREQLKGMRGK